MDTASRLVRWRLQRALRNTGWASIGGIALVIFAAGFFFSNVMPLRDVVKSQREHVKQLQMQAGKLAQVSVPARSDAQLAAFYAELPQAQQAPEVVRRLHARAREVGLVLERGEYRPVREASSKLVRYQIVLPVKGSYVQVRSFLVEAMRDTPGLALDGIGFQRQEGDSLALEAQLRLTIFLRAGA